MVLRRRPPTSEGNSRRPPKCRRRLQSIPAQFCHRRSELDRKSTRLNSSHLGISYAVVFLERLRRQPTSTLFPYTPLFRSEGNSRRPPKCRRHLQSIPAQFCHRRSELQIPALDLFQGQGNPLVRLSLTN